MMGYQIAQLAAMNGHEVSMTDVDIAVVQKALDTIKKNLQKFYVEKDKISWVYEREVNKAIQGLKGMVRPVGSWGGVKEY